MNKPGRSYRAFAAFIWFPFLLLLPALAFGAGAGGISKSSKQRLVETVLTNFSTWDVNGDGQLDAQELTHWLQEPGVKGDAAAAVAALRTSLRSHKNSPLPPFTRSYIGSSDITSLTEAFDASLTRLQNATGKPVFAADGPTFGRFKQSDHGNCYLIAATGTVVSRDPKAIRQMFEAGPTPRQYQLRFPDGLSVTTGVLTEGELASPGAPTEDGLWLRMLEKAWGMRKMLRIYGKIDPTIEPSDMIDGPIPHDITLEAMTGHRANRFDLAGAKTTITPLADLRKAVSEGATNHRRMTADVTQQTVPRILGHHAYAVLCYEPDSDTIQLWNPLAYDFTPKGPEGRKYGYKIVKGCFQMPLKDFQAVFEDIKIETREPKKSTDKTLIH